MSNSHPDQKRRDGRWQVQPGRSTDEAVNEVRPAQPLETTGRGLRIDTGQDTQFNDAWLVLALIMTGIGLILNSQFLMATALTLLVVIGFTWLWARFSLYGLQYQRHFSERRAFLGETIELTLELRNQKILPLTWLEITDTFPPDLQLDRGRVVLNPSNNLGEFHTFWMPGPFQRLTRHFSIRCTQRGYHNYGQVTVKTGDGFGFFSRKATQIRPERLIIYPHLYSVAELRLPRKNPFGDYAVKRPLFEDPLRTVGIRDWQSTDSFRRIHWKATARHQRTLSRLYEPAEEQQTLIFLNVATMVRHWQGSIPELLERAISVAGSLAAVAVEQRRPVGLIANGVLPGSDQPLRLLPGRSPNQLVRILELLAAVRPFAAQPIEAMLLREAPRLPWGASLIVVTAIAHEALLAALLDLARAGRQVVLFTLAERPPEQALPNVQVYHLPHLVEDLVAPIEVQG
jgi:uncharacterized protein (DUF58 family)